MRIPLGLALVGSLLLVPRSALPGAAPNEALEGLVRVIQDTTCPDEQRANARGQLALQVTRGDEAAIERVLRLGREASNDNVRFHVAHILAQTRMGKSIVPPAHAKAAAEILSKWFSAQDVGASVRLWAGIGLASLQDPSALPLLKEKGLDGGSDPVIRVAVARALGGWRGPALAKEVVPLLLPLLKEKEWEMRVAGCDALRLTELDSEETVEPLLEVAREETDERVWRAAVFALRRLSGGALTIPQGAEDAERKQKLQVWENAWRRKHKAAAAKEKE